MGPSTRRISVGQTTLLFIRSASDSRRLTLTAAARSRRKSGPPSSKAAKGGTDLNFDDFAAAFKPAARRPTRSDGASNERSRMTKWLRAVIRSDVGSYFEGPGLNQRAPDFTLSQRDGNRQITLSKYRANKPLVLVLGSFSCGGFRSHYRAVEDLQKRYSDELQFLAVYVRERILRMASVRVSTIGLVSSSRSRPVRPTARRLRKRARPGSA